MWDGALSSPVKISMAEEMPGSSPVSKISRLLSARMVLSALFLSNTVSHIVLTPLESATQRSVVEWEWGVGWGGGDVVHSARWEDLRARRPIWKMGSSLKTSNPCIGCSISSTEPRRQSRIDSMLRHSTHLFYHFLTKHCGFAFFLWLWLFCPREAEFVWSVGWLEHDL